MPYRFSVRIREILDATGKMGDSLQFFQWKRDDIDHQFRLEPLYVPGMADHLDPTATVDYLLQGSYSIFNRSAQSVTLRIPPVLPSMMRNAAKVPGKKRAAEAWGIKFMAAADDGAALAPIYCGYAPGMKKSVFPPAPSFSMLRAFVYDRAAQMRSGHYICEEAAAGFTREIRIDNNADSARTLQFRLETAGTLPEGFGAFCYDARTRTIDTAGTVTVDPQSSASRWVIAGDAEYREAFITTMASLKFTLGSLYPNPARSVVNIRYTVPFGAEERLRVAVYNMLGKKVWEKRIDALLTAGQHIICWNGCDRQGHPAGSGMYIVELLAIDRNDKPVKRFERRATLLR